MRFRYNVTEGTDFWVVYNEGLDTDRGSGLPEVRPGPLSLSRALIVKYSQTLTF